MELWQLIARESARDLVARYNACGDADRLDEMMALFADDAVMDVGDWGVHEGKAAIRSFFDGVRRPVSQSIPDAQPESDRYIRHFTATHMIDIEDERTAHGRCYFQVLTQSGLDHWGRYLDTYTHTGEHWLFARREVLVDGLTPNGWAASRRTAVRET